MLQAFRWACASAFFTILAVISFAPAQESKYSIKIAQNAVPQEVAEPIKKLLGTGSVQVMDPSGKALCEVWLRQEVPADATPEQVKNGLTYREVKQSEVMGVVKFEQEWRDYRKQKVKAGVYTLRLGYQPMDGDHTGSSDFQDFLLILDATKDTKADLLDAKHMIEVSAKSIGTGHPAVFMLFPNNKPAAAPVLAAKPREHWVLESKADVLVAGKKTGTSLGIGLTLVGSAE